MSLNHKIDFAVIFTVTNANPNGDPLDGNRPRTTLEGLGEISDVCLKRKIRNKLMDMGQNIFVQSDDRRVDDYKTLKERLCLKRQRCGKRHRRLHRNQRPSHYSTCLQQRYGEYH